MYACFVMHNICIHAGIKMAQKPQVKIYEKYYEKYFYKFVKCLPMDDAHFIAALTAHKLLPGDTYARIEALSTQAEKTLHFLQHVIKPGLDGDNTSSFDKLLSVMQSCSFDHVKKLAYKIKSKIDKASYIKPGMYVRFSSYM